MAPRARNLKLRALGCVPRLVCRWCDLAGWQWRLYGLNRSRWLIIYTRVRRWSAFHRLFFSCVFWECRLFFSWKLGNVTADERHISALALCHGRVSPCPCMVWTSAGMRAFGSYYLYLAFFCLKGISCLARVNDWRFLFRRSYWNESSLRTFLVTFLNLVVYIFIYIMVYKYFFLVNFSFSADCLSTRNLYSR
jgi:hypothetical protein